MKTSDVAKLMGKRALVYATVHKVTENLQRTWEKKELSEPRSGWITGIRWVQVGTYNPGSGHYGNMDWEDYDPPSLEVKKVFPVLLVTFWPNMRPVKVPMGSFRVQDDSEDPQPYHKKAKWTDQQRKGMQQEAREWPRDEKGRWLPCRWENGEWKVVEK